MIQNWKKLISSPQTTISEALKKINNGGIGISCVVDKNKKLIGIITDGDIRRAIIKNFSLDTQIEKIMNKNFQSSYDNDDKKNYNKMKRYNIFQLPILNNKQQITNIMTLNHFAENQLLKNPVVIMAGGFGKRLLPLTKNIPKPMLKIKGVPLLESTICSLRDKGINEIIIMVHYKSDVIINYFKDGAKFDVSISYIKENKPLGTMGGLSLIKKFKNNEPILIVNGDVLTHMNYRSLINSHIRSKKSITVCARSVNYKIPYGVIKIKNNQVVEIAEKPVESHVVNAGIYVLDQKLLLKLTKNKYLDMTDFLKRELELKNKINIFSLYEDWKDIGKLEDYNSVK